jgi:hypothetical protein
MSADAACRGRHRSRGTQRGSTKRYVSAKTFEVERETDEHRLAQRKKQLEMGLKLDAYQIYTQIVPK